MARLLFPDEGSRLAYSVGSTKYLQHGAGSTVTVYTDQACTTLANIQTTGGVAITGSVLTVNAASHIPDFLGPNDDTDTLYAKSGTFVSIIRAETDVRIDAVKQRANHTGTQPASSITGLATVATSGSASDLATGTLPVARVPDLSGTYALVGQTEPLVFSVTGPVADLEGQSRIYVEGNYTITSVRAAVGTAPVGGTEIVDVKKNGTTIFTTQANRPTIAAGGNTATGTPDVTTLASGDYLTVDVDADGTATTRAQDLTVTVRLRRTS